MVGAGRALRMSSKGRSSCCRATASTTWRTRWILGNAAAASWSAAPSYAPWPGKTSTARDEFIGETLLHDRETSCRETRAASFFARRVGRENPDDVRRTENTD